MTQTVSSTSKRPKFVTLALTTALASATLAGCTTQVAPRADASVSDARTAMAKGKTQKAMSHAEAAVLAEPRNAANRAMLGGTYMQAGRFNAAATTFGDAIELGDTSARTALSFALAKVAQGDNPAALAALEKHRNVIGADDLGLALALAGRPDQGVAVLSQTLRSGYNTPKLRQNLAYAYALQGNWRAARVMVAEDVPADQVDARISDWAQMAKPEDHHKRVASLLQVSVVADPGQPQALALGNHPAHETLVAEAAERIAPEQAVAPVALASVAPSANNAKSVELPAVAPANLVPASLAASADPKEAGASSYALPPLEDTKPAVVSVAAKAPPAKTFAAAFNADEAKPAALPTGTNFAEVAADGVRFVSNPIVQAVPASEKPAVAAAPAPRRSAAVAARVSGEPKQATVAAAPKKAPAAAPAAAAMANDGDHLIQLGSYNSEKMAKAGWTTLTKRYPQLSKFQMVITEAEVRGKKYYRVSAGGFKQGDAKSMCSTLKGKGQGCIAWADGKPLPGALKKSERLARR